jgi:hypothetical protein
MKKILPFKTATFLSLILFGLFVFFHFLVIIGIVFFNYVPIDFLWGGRMQTREQLLVFEIISLTIMALCFFLVLVKSKRIKWPKIMGIVNLVFWLLFILFLLNTIGNIFAKTAFEKFFAIVTFILAVLSLRLAIEKN